MNRMVFVVVLGILVFSLIAVSAEQGVATIHVQTFGYEGRDVVTLNVTVTGEDADYLYIAIDAEVLDKLKKEINIEKLPVVKVSEVMFKIPRIYLREVRANEYVIVVPNNVTKMKWCIRDKIKGMNKNDIVRVLVWFKEPYSVNTVKKFGTVYYEFLSGMGAAVDIRVSHIKGLSEAADIEFVEAEGTAQILLSQSVPLINADDVWAMGYDGTGVSICVIDTGIDPGHCDFPGGKIIAWADYIGSSSTPYDDHGHGTHIASIAAGEDSPYGVAPGANLMAAKVCTSGGSCSDSDIIQGIDFGVAQGADVENISLGGPGSDGTSAVAQECDWAVDQGVVVCVAAGNGGECCTINTPGDARKVITVGASTKGDALASCSSKGPTFDDRTKPDIVAPGVSIYAAQAGTACNDVGMSCTSMATPHIAGVAALMLDARGTATPIQVKKCMGAAAVDKFNCGKDCLWGWGRVDAYAAVNQIINNPNVTPPDDAIDRGCTVEDCGLPLPPTPTVTITNPDDGSHAHGNETVNITASTQGYINEVKFYLIWIIDEDTVTGELLGTDDNGPPFECTWDTTGYQVQKWYTIRADGYYYDHHLRDVDEITVKLRPPSGTFFPTRIITSHGVGLGTALTALFVLFGSIGIITKKRIKEAMCHARKVNVRGKKTAALTLVMLLSLSIPAALSSTDTLTVDYHFDSFVMTECGPLIEDTFMHSIAGEPVVPYYPATILLPEGATVKDVKVKTGAPVVLKGFEFPWGQPPCTFSDTPVMVGPNEAIYSSDNDYPNTLFEVMSVGSFRGFQILNVNLFPVQYKPQSGTVKFYEKLTVEVQFGKGLKNKLYRGLAGDKADVAGMVDNPEVVSTYGDGPAPLATEEYIIITNDTMQPIFQQLATWKASFVNGATVYTVSWITSTYSGVDNPDKIRNFIIDKYTNNGTKYVLMGGDIAAVPYRGFYVSTGGYTDSDMLADMYFAHLDGSHNSDGDSYWGETNDNVDFTAEIAVGRAPCQSTTEAQAFVDKVIAYEQMDKPDVGSHKRVCFHQSRVQPGNSPDSRCLAYNCDNWIPGDYYIDYLFEETGTVTKTKWINAWAAEPIVVVHIGHGNTNVYHINYELGGTISWYNSDVPSMTNTFFPWTTSVACITGNIIANDCLAEAYVMDDCGAIGAIYNENYGWFSTLNACQYSGEFCEKEIRACWSDGFEKLGDILNKARSYLASSAQSNSYYRWCYYERNLVGDPETPCLTTRGTPYVTITNPTEGQTVSGTITCTATSNCDSVKWYIDGVFKEEDFSAPFEYVWGTCPELEGGHTIRAEGYIGGVYQIEDTGNVTVNNKIIITYPEDREPVSGTVNITTFASNCVETVKFYLIWITDDGNVTGELLPEDSTAPFECSWDTTEYQVWKWYTIRADAYWGNGVKDVDEITVQLRPPSYAMHLGRIITPSGGAGLGTVLTALLVLFGSVGMTKRR